MHPTSDYTTIASLFNDVIGFIKIRKLNVIKMYTVADPSYFFIDNWNDILRLGIVDY